MISRLKWYRALEKSSSVVSLATLGGIEGGIYGGLDPILYAAASDKQISLEEVVGGMITGALGGTVFSPIMRGLGRRVANASIQRGLIGLGFPEKNR